MITVVSTVIGADEAALKLSAVAARMLNFAPALNDIGDFYRNQVRAQFDAAPWQPLAPLTVYLRGGGSTPLTAGGMLKASWTTTGGPGNINEVGAMTAKFGSAHTKVNHAGQTKGVAGIHQVGSPGGMVPARPVMLVTPPLETKIVTEYISYLFGGF